MLCLDIISNLILATLKGRVRGKGEGVRECGRRRICEGEGLDGGVLTNTLYHIVTNN